MTRTPVPAPPSPLPRRRWLPLAVLVLAFGTTLAWPGVTAERACGEGVPEERDPQVFALSPPEADVREILVDLTPWTSEPEVARVTYDPQQVLRPLRRHQLSELPTWALAVRLILSEVGTGRLHSNRWGTVEAVGVLQTVHNRLQSRVWNPEGIERLGGWPGCDPELAARDYNAAFAACLHPSQYLGLYKRRGLRPADYGDEAQITEAIDRAVAAWWLVRHAAVPDVTGGATMYVHRCGGRAYGATTPHCNRDDTTPDIPGARPHHGPLAFRAPHRFQTDRGLYTMRLSSVIDYEPGPPPVAPHGVATYLYGRSTDPTARDPYLLRDLHTLDDLHRARRQLRGSRG